MTDQQRIAALAAWLVIRKLWTQAAQAAASQAADDALDDFIKQHDSPSTDKTKNSSGQ